MITCSTCHHRAHEGVCVACIEEYEEGFCDEDKVCVTSIAPMREVGEFGESYSLTHADFERQTLLTQPCLEYAFRAYKDSGETFASWWARHEEDYQ